MKYTQRIQKLVFTFFLLTFCLPGLLSCGSSQFPPAREKSESERLAERCIAAWEEKDPNFFSYWDETFYPKERWYKSIFGGYGASYLRQFFYDRVAYFISLEDIDEHLIQIGKKNNTSKKVQVVAQNLGFSLWMSGLDQNKIFFLPLKNGERIPIRSPRPGIILFDEGFKLENYRSIYYLQSALIHEARHSDCSGGISLSEVEELRSRKDPALKKEFLMGKKCGYTHTVCRDGDYEGAEACEGVHWGPYAIQSIFLSTVLAARVNEILSPPKGSQEESRVEASSEISILNMQIADLEGRMVGFTIKDLLRGKYGIADLSSSGLYH